MSKQLNVNLGFTADTSQAAAQIQNLQNQLTGLLNSTNGSMNFGSKVVGDVNKASKAIAELKMHLKNATNVNTGTLDFTKLNESIGKSGTTLQQYGDKLRSLGPAGQQAFNALANSVAQSEIPIRRSNAALTEMWTTLKNTARWQISSSILHGFMGAISSAVGYAKDLNKSLNDIRIVTGASVDQMAQFAEQANRSAKALSASTTEYTKASLIYYQQGLDDQAVKERTDVTIKMANVSGQAAETVSDQMTAVWNNFAKGGEDLERFADVMVRLGADTASSSDEIAQGLEKFAAIGDMVGLSFDNAAAALATVTATTRQSADVVGTAFKTIFARIQGLKLGETLEDGTDLNKYSEALATVGISIKEQNGELKDMDNILAEMGAKWGTLSKDQQVALAQTVAGVRQYNQLVALMDNFDFYEQNLQSAATADGSLQEQADIYAESWQAASDRVKAATQGIYEDLLNDEAFIDILNIIEKILTYVDNLIDGLGGLGGVLTTVGVLLTRAFSAQIAQGITSMTNSIKMMTAAGREQAQQQKAQFMKDSADAMRGMSDGSNEGNVRATMMEDQLRLQTSMIENSERMSAEEQQINQMLLDRQRILSENAIAAAKELDAATEARSDATFNARVELAQEARGWAGGDLEAQKKNLSDFTKQFNQIQQKLKQGITARVNLEELRKLPAEGEKGKQVIDKIKQAIDKIDDTEIKEIISSLDTMELNAENVEDAIAALMIRLREMQGASEANMMDENNEWMLSEDAVHGLSAAYEDEATAALRAKDAEEQANEARDNAANSINNATGAQKTWADQMVTSANVVMSIMSALQALNGIIDVATNPDMSGWEKFLSIGSSLAMMFVMLAPLLTGTNLQFLATASASIGAALGMKAQSVAALQASAATGTLSASLWSLLWPIGLVVAAIAGIVFIGSKLISFFKSLSQEAKLDALQEETKKAGEAFENTKTRIEETKTALDSLQSGYETIEQLKKGTVEWYEAISNVNAEVLKLAEQYPDLSQFIYSDEGVLKINDEGNKWLAQEMENQYTAAANYQMSSQIRENEQKYIVGKSGYKDPTGSWLTGPNYEQMTQLIQGAYEAKGIGDTLFTKAGAQSLAFATDKVGVENRVDNAFLYDYEKYSQEARDSFVNSLGTIDWSDEEAIKDAAKNAFKTDDFEGVDFSNLSKELLDQRDSMYELLDANEEHIKGQKELKDSNQRYKDAQFEGALSSIGSIRTAEEGRELLGGQDYESVKADTKEKLTGSVENGGFGIWNNSINYKETDPEMALINDFMKQVGASEYVAQRKGELVVKIGDEEKGFSKDEVINMLTDVYSTENLQEKVKDALVPMIKEAYGVGAEELSADQLVNLDNLALGIKEGISRGFEGSEEELNQKVSSMTQAIGQAYGADTESLANDTEFINFDDAAIQEKIIKLTEGLDGSKQKAEEFKQELKEINELSKIDSMTSTFDDAAAAMGGSKEEIQQTSNQMQRYAKHLMGVSKNSKTLSKDLADNAEAAADVATSVVRMNKGIDKLADGIKDWSSVLKKSSKESVEYCDAMFEIKDAMSDVLGVSSEFLSDDFIINNMADIEKAATGDAEAIDRLAIAAAQDILVNVDFKSEGLKEKAMGLHNELVASMPDIKVGAQLENGDFLANAQELVRTAGMTVDEAQAYFNSLGYEPEFVTEEKTVMRSIPQETTHTDYAITPGTIDIMGVEVPIPTIDRITSTRVTGYEDMEETVQVPILSNDGTPQLKSLTRKSSGSMNNYSKSNSGGKSPGSSGGGKGGGGGKDKSAKPKEAKKVEPTEAKNKDEEIERYKEITEVLDDLSRELDEIGAAKDEAWGNDKIALMDKELAKLKQIVKEQKSYINQIGQIDKNGNAIGGKLKVDQDAVRALGATFDEFGRITNYEQIMGQLVDNWNSTQSSLDTREQTYEDKVAEIANTEYTEEQEAEKTAAEKANEDEKTAIDDARKKADKDYETGKEAIEQYIETLNLSEEATAQLDEYFRQMRQFNYDKLVYQIELRVELNQNDIDDIEFKLERLGENETTRIAERLVLIEENAANYIEQAKAEVWGMQEAERLYNLYLSGDEENGISKESYMKQMQEGKKAIQELEMSFRGMIKQIGEELVNAFDLANEELDKSYAKFDNLITTMEHYKTVIALTGKRGEESYAEFNKILKASQQVIQNRIASEKAEIAMWNEVIAKQKADIAQMEEGSEERIAAELALENSEEKLQETKEQLMSDIEQLGEYAREIFENSVEQAAIAFEERLFGAGQRLSDKMESIDMLNARQEELLTITNKLYETNKMIYNIEKDIDATTNQRAKQQLINFQNTVKQKQEQTDLSKFELDLLQAQYEIEKAKIALEEAQNSKSTVRLSRDSEGNYGYVYTASQDKVADAEQKLADATNAYYNTAMDGAQKYQEQIYGHIEEWEEKIKEVYLDQTLTEEEKNRKIEEINTTYNELIKQDKDLYYIAVGAMQETAYNKQLDYDLLGIKSTENWEVESKKFIEELDLAQQQYSTDTGVVRQETTDNFGDMETAINNTKIAGNTLQQDMETKLIPTLKTDLLEAVGNATLAWKGYREELEKIVELSDNAMLKASQDTKVAGSYDYAGSIMEEFAKGADADLAYIDRLAAERQKKLGNIDLTDYQALMNQYADDPNSAEYKTYAFLRSWKLDMMKKTDYTQMLKDYIANSGDINDEMAQNILKMRQQKIDYLGISDAISNEDLIDSIQTKENETSEQVKKEEPVNTTIPIDPVETTETYTQPKTEEKKPELAKGSYVEVKDGTRWYANSYGGGTSGKAKAGIIKYTNVNGTHPYNIDGLGWVKKTDIVGYNTGGYTGDWGPEGKLAMLHEKELVLNKQDTANFLTATEILRDINQMLDRNALAAQLGMIDLKAMTVNSQADQILQQEVTIHADFPNVTDHNEIELAMSNLINAASQYANREF